MISKGIIESYMHNHHTHFFGSMSSVQNNGDNGLEETHLLISVLQ